VKIWVDCTAAAHPLVLRPIIERLQAEGRDQTATAEARRKLGESNARRQTERLAWDHDHPRAARPGALPGGDPAGGGGDVA